MVNVSNWILIKFGFGFDTQIVSLKRDSATLKPDPQQKTDNCTTLWFYVMPTENCAKQ